MSRYTQVHDGQDWVVLPVDLSVNKRNIEPELYPGIVQPEPYVRQARPVLQTTMKFQQPEQGPGVSTISASGPGHGVPVAVEGCRSSHVRDEIQHYQKPSSPTVSVNAERFTSSSNIISTMPTRTPYWNDTFEPTFPHQNYAHNNWSNDIPGQSNQNVPMLPSDYSRSNSCLLKNEDAKYSTSRDHACRQTYSMPMHFGQHPVEGSANSICALKNEDAKYNTNRDHACVQSYSMPMHFGQHSLAANSFGALKTEDAKYYTNRDHDSVQSYSIPLHFGSHSVKEPANSFCALKTEDSKYNTNRDHGFVQSYSMPMHYGQHPDLSQLGSHGSAYHCNIASQIHRKDIVTNGHRSNKVSTAIRESPTKKRRLSHLTNEDLKLYKSPEFIGNLSQVEKFLMIEKAQSEALMKLSYTDPITHVYNPLEYAWDPHVNFVKKYCQNTKPILFLGMNPGPFGMAQNGVPFGETEIVNSWLEVSGDVFKPANEHPQRPILGLASQRKEVSGSRFWGFWKKVCGTPDVFFQQAFVHNICPLVFMSKSGKNVTPPQISIATRHLINAICDQALCDIVRLLNVKTIVGIGKFAQERARKALGRADVFQHVRIENIMHPSPVNPAANKGWDAIVMKQLQEMDIMKYFTTTLSPPEQGCASNTVLCVSNAKHSSTKVLFGDISDEYEIPFEGAVIGIPNT